MPYNPITDASLLARFDDQSPFLKADLSTPCGNGDVVGQWSDLTGNGFHAVNASNAGMTFASNLYNGLPGINCAAVSGQGLIIADPDDVLAALQSTDHTVMVCCTAAELNTSFCFTKSGAGGAGVGPWTMGCFTGGVGGMVPSQYALSGFGGAYPATYPTMSSLGHKYGATAGNGGSSDCRVIYNGSQSNGITLQAADSTNPITVGCWSTPGGGSFPWNGSISAIYIYSRYLSPAECFQVDQYWRTRYAQPWPGASSPFISVGASNSIWGDYPLWRYVVPNIEGMLAESHINIAFSSDDWDAMTVRGASVDAMLPLLSGYGKPVVLLAWEGTNQMFSFQGNSDGATAYAKGVAYQSARTTAGWQRQVCGSVMSRQDTGDVSPGFDSRRHAYNALIEANFASLAPVCTMADVGNPDLGGSGANAIMGADGAWSNLTYFDGSVHPEPPGDTLLGPFFGDAMSAAAAATINTVVSRRGSSYRAGSRSWRGGGSRLRFPRPKDIR